MELIIGISSFCAFTNELLHFLQLTFVSSFKPGRVMKDELWVTGEGKCMADIVDTMLMIFVMSR